MACPGFFKAASIAELAGRIGVPAGNLAATVSRFNGFAKTGNFVGIDRATHNGRQRNVGRFLPGHTRLHFIDDQFDRH